MKKTAICFSAMFLSMAHSTFANTQQLEERVCKGKAQNTAVSYAYQGVLFNGTCQPNEHGKLSFQSPQPATQNHISTETTIAVTTHSEDLDVDAPELIEPEQENDDADLITEIDQPIINE